MTNFNPSPEQQIFFDWITNSVGNVQLEAVAGSGKSTTLVHGSLLMKGSVAGMAYNKKAGEDLKAKAAELGGTPHVVWGTCHSFGLQAFKTNRKFPKIDASGDKHKRLMEQFGIAPAMWPFYRAALSMAKQKAFGVRGYPTSKDLDAWQAICEEYRLFDSLPQREEEVPEDFMAALPQLLIKSNYALDLIDFDDMIYLPLIHEWNIPKFDWVLMDEDQDANDSRRELAARMLSPKGRFVGVGDRHQAIYGFTGADANSIDLIREKFNCQELSLSVSFRCAQAVVREAHNYVSHIQPHPSAPLGTVNEIDLNSQDGDFNWWRNVQPGEAILCRNTKPLVSLAFQFIRCGIGAKVEGRAIGQGLKALVRKWKWKSKEEFDKHLVSYREAEVKTALAKKKNQYAEFISDKVESLRALLGAQTNPTADALCGLIDEMFEDGVRPNFILLSTIHKAKGREWNHVYWLGPNKYQPSPFAQLEWEQEQENNLMYVAATRAKTQLTKVLVQVERLQSPSEY